MFRLQGEPMSDLLHPSDSDPEDAPETPSDPGEFVLAVIADDQVEAQLLLSMCEEAGIPAILVAARSGPVGTITSPVDGFKILVPQNERERARRLVGDRKGALEADPEGGARAAEEEEAETEPT
jgi:hypothetical protein